MMQRTAAIKKASLFRDLKRMPTEHELWNAVLGAIVFTPTDFIEKLESIKEMGDRLDVVLWDEDQLFVAGILDVCLGKHDLEQ